MPKLKVEEVEALLRRAGILRLATIDQDGSPSIVPLAFLYREGKVLLTARARSAWLANLRRTPRVSVCVDESRYPLRKVLIKGQAQIIFEPGEDDKWRDLRLPLPSENSIAPSMDEPGQEWSYDAAYREMTHDELRALVAIPLAGSTVTSWRLPVEGEYLDGSWASRYYENKPRRFKVVVSDALMSGVRVVAE
jgi:nitroimidazol reductase NimA-like FMN-containing flavoprotein (pyridoxamine 5'-phosphate oxidase superfamily)